MEATAGAKRIWVTLVMKTVALVPEMTYVGMQVADTVASRGVTCNLRLGFRRPAPARPLLLLQNVAASPSDNAAARVGFHRYSFA
jgi:hypothetical protein